MGSVLGPRLQPQLISRTTNYRDAHQATAGNGGRVVADAAPLHGFGASAPLVLPANSLLVFAR